MHFFDAETLKKDTIDDAIGSFLRFNNVSLKERDLIIVFFNLFLIGYLLT